MKKLILSILSVGLAATSFAHGWGSGTDQGNWLLYGVGSFSNTHGTSSQKFGTTTTNTTDNPRILMWQVSPGLGYNVMDCLTIGVDFDYTGSKTNYDKKTAASFPFTDQTKTFDYGIGPFVRWSMPLGEHFYAFSQFTAHYLNGRFTTRYATAAVGGNSYEKDDNYKGFDVGLMPSVGVSLTKTLGLNFSIGGISYNYKKYDYSNQGYAVGTELSQKTNDFQVTFGQQVNIGISKWIGCGHKMHGHAEPMDDTRNTESGEDSNTDENADKGKKHHKMHRHHKSDEE